MVTHWWVPTRRDTACCGREVRSLPIKDRLTSTWEKVDCPGTQPTIIQEGS